MARKLFVGGLSWNTTDEGLRAAFGRFGTVVEAKVVTDRETGRSRGFGFVAFQNPADSESAMQAMDGAALDMRQIRVSVAEDKPRGPRPDGPPRSAEGPRPGGPGRPFNDRGAPDSRAQPPREAPAGDRGFSPRPSGPPWARGARLATSTRARATTAAVRPRETSRRRRHRHPPPRRAAVVATAIATADVTARRTRPARRNASGAAAGATKRATATSTWINSPRGSGGRRRSARPPSSRGEVRSHDGPRRGHREEGDGDLDVDYWAHEVAEDGGGRQGRRRREERQFRSERSAGSPSRTRRASACRRKALVAEAIPSLGGPPSSGRRVGGVTVAAEPRSMAAGR
ncbi:RNA recognition motif domain-containing protein [Nannocystis pusilla]|uniref:RNA recognition motif domain-containing protein n=1 Tax=Nannocystis pusilla TaxID=889268 RepID=UPI003B7A743A